MLKKRLILIAITLLAIMSLSFTSFAHSGRTDASGGHKDNKNKSGLGYYHYHCGGHPPHLHSDGICPYDTNINLEVNTPEPTKVQTPKPTKVPTPEPTVAPTPEPTIMLSLTQTETPQPTNIVVNTQKQDEPSDGNAVAGIAGVGLIGGIALYIRKKYKQAK